MQTVHVRPGEARNGFEAAPTERALRVAFAVGGLYTEGSGVARIVCDLANALLRQGTPVEVYTADCPGRGADGTGLSPGNRLHAAPGTWMGRLAWSPALAAMLDRAAGELDVIHNHSLWMLPTHYARRAAARRGVPVVWTVHGFLEPWALAHSRWKKRLAGWAFQDRDLRSAACLVVNSLAELASVRDYGLRNPVAVIPNGVNLEDFAALPPREEFEQRCPDVRGKRVCLFLSRLHEKKGLGHLVEAWSRMCREFGEWQLVVAGPDDGYEVRLRERIAALRLDRSVSVTGALYGEAKRAAWSRAEAFVLPSFSEGFSMAALEAIAAGLPALLTPGCHFPEASRAGAAIEAAPTAEGMEDGLRRLLGMSDVERREMGTQGRALVESGYTWNAVARRTLDVYRCVSNAGAGCPDIFYE